MESASPHWRRRNSFFPWMEHTEKGMKKRIVASSSIAALVLVMGFSLICAGCSGSQEPATVPEYLKVAEGLERGGDALSLPKRIWIYEEILASQEADKEVRQAVRMKLEACQRNYFANAFRDNAEMIRKDDLEQQARAWQERYEQLARLTDSLKAENQMLRSKVARQEEAMNGMQGKGDGRK